MESNDSGEGVQEATWWGSSYDSSETPTATSFSRVEDSTTATSSEGFVSLMDDASYSVAPSRTESRASRHPEEDDEEEDLGFGNSKPKPKSGLKDEEVKNTKEGSSSNKAEDTKPVEPARPGKFQFIARQSCNYQ